MLCRISRAVLAVLFSSALTAPSVAQPDYLALITDLEGTIEVAKAGQTDATPAMWGMQLFAGDRVTTKDGSTVSLLFSNNNLVVLGPNSAMAIAAGPGAAGRSTVKTINDDLYGTLANLKLKGADAGRGRALAGLRAGDDLATTLLISPRNTKLKTRRPAFTWQPQKSYDGFEVKLFDASGLVWSRHVEGNRLDYPEDEAPLVAGRSYFWQVDGQTMLDAETSEKAGFSILSEEALSEVESQESALATDLSGDGMSFSLALGAYYARQGLYESAIASFREIAERHPTAVLPHEILGRLYSEVGLKDRALAEMRQAVSLSQTN